MKIKAIVLLTFCVAGLCQAQKQGNIWYFGLQAGLNFNTSPPSALLNGQTYPFPLGWNEGCSSISDSSGNLLFYSNGMKIWNKQQQLMPHGDSLLGNTSSTQACIIVPLPGSSRYFYVFTTDAIENNLQNGLRYNLVDLCLDGGLGDIVPGMKNIKLLDTVAEKLACVVDSSNLSYWILTHKYNSDAFYAYKLTSSGITDTIVSHTGTIDYNGVGQMVISPNTQKLAYAICSAQSSSKCFFADFDNGSGSVANEKILSSGDRVYGLAFSPNSSQLYCSANGIGDVYQYNLNSGSLSSVIASKIYIVQNGPDSWRQMLLGPDKKIYLSRTGKLYLSKIEFPDSSCPNCLYVDSAIYLGGRQTSFGLPTLVAGYEYSNSVASCGSGVKYENESAIIVFPNPNTGLLKIKSSYGLESIFLFNSIGDVIFEKSNNCQLTESLDMSRSPEGIYFLKISSFSREEMFKIIKLN